MQQVLEWKLCVLPFARNNLLTGSHVPCVFPLCMQQVSVHRSLLSCPLHAASPCLKAWYYCQHVVAGPLMLRGPLSTQASGWRQMRMLMW